MAKYKIVHYLNQFFGGIGGEDKADFQPEVREEIIGPGMALNAGLGDDYEIVATVICGDNYFGENLDKAIGCNRIVLFSVAFTFFAGSV